ncbi:MAG: hypothetical protein AAFR05_21475 [Bacteroidota bacterium]
MLVGAVDFQKAIRVDGDDFFGAHWQEDVFYLLPATKVVIKEDPVLAFLLSIFYSEELQVIHGKLNFTTQFNFSDIDHLSDFRKMHPEASVNPLPFQPFRLSFDAPGTAPPNLAQAPYETNWSNTANSNFLISTDSDSTLFLQQMLLDSSAGVGFSARLDVSVEGLSPRYPYAIDADAQTLIAQLASGLGVVDGVFIYSDLISYITSQFDRLSFRIKPLPPDELKGPLAEVLVDRLFKTFGHLYAGPAASNLPYLQLPTPQTPSLVYFNLEDLTLVRRPFTYTLDPFEAAIQLAQRDPNQVIAKIETPKIPVTELRILLNYFLPPGLSESVRTDFTITVPPGSLYPVQQVHTELLRSDTNLLEYKFVNNRLDGSLDFSYRVRVTYFYQGIPHTVEGEERKGKSTILTLLQSDLPILFLNLKLDPQLAIEAKLRGTYHSKDLRENFELTAERPYFSYPILSPDTYVHLLAESLESGKTVELPTRLTMSTTIIGPNFPTFGTKRAQVTAAIPAGKYNQKVFFQPEGSEAFSEHDFTVLTPHYEYVWYVPSIFETRFRYRVEGREWSAYYESGSSITIP